MTIFGPKKIFYFINSDNNVILDDIPSLFINFKHIRFLRFLTKIGIYQFLAWKCSKLAKFVPKTLKISKISPTILFFPSNILVLMDKLEYKTKNRKSKVGKVRIHLGGILGGYLITLKRVPTKKFVGTGFFVYPLVWVHIFSCTHSFWVHVLAKFCFSEYMFFHVPRDCGYTFFYVPRPRFWRNFFLYLIALKPVPTDFLWVHTFLCTQTMIWTKFLFILNSAQMCTQRFFSGYTFFHVPRPSGYMFWRNFFFWVHVFSCSQKLWVRVCGYIFSV